jgi:hypothetical protein
LTWGFVFFRSKTSPSGIDLSEEHLECSLPGRSRLN